MVNIAQEFNDLSHTEQGLGAFLLKRLKRISDGVTVDIRAPRT